MLWSKTRATACAEAVQLVLLARERLDDADPGDALLGLRRQLGDPLLHLLHGRAVRRGCSARRWRPRTAPAASASNARQGSIANITALASMIVSSVLGEEDQPVAEEEADRLQVNRRPRHQLPGLLGIEEAQLQPLQMRVKALAQVELDRQRDLARDDASHHSQPQAQNRRRR